MAGPLFNSMVHKLIKQLKYSQQRTNDPTFGSLGTWLYLIDVIVAAWHRGQTERRTGMLASASDLAYELGHHRVGRSAIAARAPQLVVSGRVDEKTESRHGR